MKLNVFGLQAEGSPGDVAANLAELAAAARTAKSRGGDVLVTPELFVTGYNIGDLVGDLARQDLVGMVAQIARTEQIALVAGLPEHDDGRLFNSAVFIDETGTTRATYRKTHLFGDLDRKYFTAGDELTVSVDYRGVRCALLICYDVEFPETARAAAVAGAHVLLVSTALMEPFEWIAEEIVRARAWENQLYLAYVNHAGAEGDLRYVGRSSIIDPSARVLDSIVDATGLVCGVIDTEVVDAARLANPYLLDRRRDLIG